MHRSAFIALLRGINVGGHNRVPMAELRSLCADLSWRDVRTYIQSGNLIFEAGATQAALEEALERAIERRFGLSIPVIVRSAADWSVYVKGNPFPDESRTEPNLVMLAVSKHAAKQDALVGLRERAAAGERIVRVDEVFWIHYVRGVGTSKLSPGLLDRLVGSPVTTRNWRTVLQLEELGGHAGPPWPC